jgi:ABC-type histidine transport system ATPase subunit
VIVKGEPKEEATARARELLAKVGLAGKETSYPRRLLAVNSNVLRLHVRWQCVLR